MDKKLPVELIGVGKGLLITLILCFLMAPLIYFTGIKETIMPTLGNIILAIGVFWCGCSVSRFYGSKGLVRGLIMGLAFFIFLLIVTFICDFSLISIKAFFYTLSLCLVSGALGGILGIGLSDKAI